MTQLRQWCWVAALSIQSPLDPKDGNSQTAVLYTIDYIETGHPTLRRSPGQCQSYQLHEQDEKHAYGFRESHDSPVRRDKIRQLAQRGVDLPKNLVSHAQKK